MSESSTPIVVGEARGGDSRRVKILAGVGVALLVAALVIPRLLGGGGDDGADDLASAPTPTATTTIPTDSGQPAAAGTSRNPFQPLSAAGQNPPAAVPVSAGETVVSNQGTGAPPGGGGGSTEPLPGVPPSVVTVTGVRFTLLEVLDGPAAIVRIDDQVIEGLQVNGTFAGSFRVSSLDIATRCGTFVYGDRRIALCEGEEAVV